MIPYQAELTINGKTSKWWVYRVNGKTYIGKSKKEATSNPL